MSYQSSPEAALSDLIPARQYKSLFVYTEIKASYKYIKIDLLPEYIQNYSYQGSSAKINDNKNYPLIKINLHYIPADIDSIIEQIVEMLYEYISLVKILDNSGYITLSIESDISRMLSDIKSRTDLEKETQFCLLYNLLNAHNIFPGEYKNYINFMTENQHSSSDVSEYLTMKSIYYYNSPSFPRPYIALTNYKREIESMLDLRSKYQILDFFSLFTLVKMNMFDLSYIEAIQTRKICDTFVKNGFKYINNIPFAKPDVKISDEINFAFQINTFTPVIDRVIQYDRRFESVSHKKMMLAISTVLSTYDFNTKTIGNFNDSITAFLLQKVIDGEISKNSQQEQTKSFHLVAIDFLNDDEQQTLVNLINEYNKNPALTAKLEDKKSDYTKHQLSSALYSLLRRLDFNEIRYRHEYLPGFAFTVYCMKKLPTQLLQSPCHLVELLEQYCKNLLTSLNPLSELLDIYIEHDGKVPAYLCASLIGIDTEETDEEE